MHEVAVRVELVGGVEACWGCSAVGVEFGFAWVDFLKFLLVETHP